MRALVGPRGFYPLALILLLSAVGTAGAELVLYRDRPTFSAQGGILFNYGFEDHGTGFTQLPTPYNRDGVSYITGDNLVVGTATFYIPISNVFAYNFWTPLPALIDQAGRYNMFALDLAYLGRNDPILFQVTTNLRTYNFPDLRVPLASVAQDFYGFVTTDPNEYFTGFRLSSTGAGSAPVIDNVTLGDSTIPEPATLTLACVGALGLLGYGYRRRRSG